MLIDTTVLEPNATKRFIRWSFSGTIAECPETGAQLRIGSGRRRAGRARRYFIYVPRTHLPAGLFDGRRQMRSQSLIAVSANPA